jgi:exosortase
MNGYVIEQGRSTLLRAAAILLLPVMILLYYKTGLLTVRSFTEHSGNMSHGWLIPVLSLHALWRRRFLICTAEKRFVPTGVLGVLAALSLLWLGKIYSLLWLQQLSFVSMLWSLVYNLWGREVAKFTMFPVWYLAFVISMPSVLEKLAEHLQTFSATISYALMRGFNLEILQQGNRLLSYAYGSGFRFEIAQPCSGIRSLQALTAFTALYAWHTQKGVLRKWLLFLCSIPIAVLSNIIRVFSVCLAAAVFGEYAATGYYHDYSGYAAVLAAMLLIFKTGDLLKNLRDC